MILLMLIFSPHRARAAEATQRTAAIMTWHSIGEQLAPSRTFSGVVLNGRYVVTSRRALEKGHTNPFTGRSGELSRIQGVVRQNDQLITFDLSVWASPRTVIDDLVLLEVVESDRETLAQFIRHLPTLGRLTQASPARLIGVLAPLGVEEVTPRTIPQPLELAISWEQPLRNRGTLAVPSEPTYASQMVGAGVWTDQQELLGVLVREDRGWWVVDASVVEELGMLAGLNWDAPEDFREFTGPNVRRPDPRPRAELRGIYELLDRNGLQMQLDRNLVDFVNQPQADLIMTMIAGGEYDRALNLLDRIEPLVTGRLMEQMTYRRALALILNGRPDDARRGLVEVHELQDDLARARGMMLRRVLEADAERQLGDLDITRPDGLAEACLRVLGELEREFAEELEQTGWRVGVSPDQTVLAELEEIQGKVLVYRLSWPSYFKPMLDRMKNMRNEIES